MQGPVARSNGLATLTRKSRFKIEGQILPFGVDQLLPDKPDMSRFVIGENDAPTSLLSPHFRFMTHG